MNWAEVNTQEELLSWVPEDFLLSSGRRGYYRLTGFEETGLCWWCGSELTGHQEKYCRSKHRDEEGHWHIYYKHFSWTYARYWCIERYDYRCANCGYYEIVPEGHHPSWYIQNLEVHHIIPIEGNERDWTPFNLPWNLICLCHGCHLEIHDAMKIKHLASTKFDQAIKRGQLVLEGIVS